MVPARAPAEPIAVISKSVHFRKKALRYNFFSGLDFSVQYMASSVTLGIFTEKLALATTLWQ